jgi:hypothetical protein
MVEDKRFGRPAEAAEWECRTVHVKRYQDGLSPEYVVVKDATMWDGGGSNGRAVCKPDAVTVNGAELSVEDRAGFGDWHNDETVTVVFDGETAELLIEPGTAAERGRRK